MNTNHYAGDSSADDAPLKGTVPFSLTRKLGQSPNGRLLWLTIVVVGAVFFFVAHDLQISRYEQFTPWSEGEVLEAGRNTAKGMALALVGLLGAYLVLRRDDRAKGDSPIFADTKIGTVPDGRPLGLQGWLPGLMIFYLAWSAASVLWSIDPGMSVRRLAVLECCVLGAAGFARQFRPRDLAFMAMVVTGAYLLVGVAAEAVLGTFHPWASGYRFAGTVHPNTQGAHLVVLCLASLCLARSASRRQAWFWGIFAAGLVFLLLTKSRTSCAALAVALGVLGWVELSDRARTSAVLGGACVVCAAALVGTLFGIDLDDKVVEAASLGRQEGLETLTGRMPIWSELLGYVEARPLWGYGYESFWTAKHIEAISDELEWPLREAHNSYLDTVLSVGLIGAAAFLAAVLLALRRAAIKLRETRDPAFAFTLCLLAAGMVSGCLETGMTSVSLITLIAGTGVVQLLARP